MGKIPHSLNVLAFPPRFQWEASAGPPERSAANNCGPTGSSQQVDYYREPSKPVPIEYQRTLAGIPHGGPTNAWQQADILEAHGVDASVVELNTLGQLDALVGRSEGHRPVGIGILMARMTARTRGHSFLGWHRVTILRRKKRWSLRRLRWVDGYIYTDPNFNPLYRPDPRKGHRWISRGELRFAFIQNWPRYAIVPNHRKRAS